MLTTTRSLRYATPGHTIGAVSRSGKYTQFQSLSFPDTVVNEDMRLPSVTPLTPPCASRKRKYPEGDVATRGS